MPSCVVKGCSSGSRRPDPSAILHVFPKDKEMITKWLQATGQQFKDLTEFVNRIYDCKKYDTYRMCSKHFTPDSYRYKPKSKTRKLTPNAVPSIFTEKTPGEAPANKRRKIVDPACLKPGERCPTCSQLIPENFSPKTGRGANGQEAANGITNQSTQEPNQGVTTITERLDEPTPHSPALQSCEGITEKATVLNPTQHDQDYNSTPHGSSLTHVEEMLGQGAKQDKASDGTTNVQGTAQSVHIKTELPDDSERLTVKTEQPGDESRVSTVKTDPDNPDRFTVQIAGSDGVQTFTIKIERPDEF